MRRWRDIAGPALAAIMAAAWTAGCGSEEPDRPVAAGPRPPDAAVVTIPGQLEAADAVGVTRRSQTWENTELAIEKIVPEGSRVQEGDFLCQFDSTQTSRAEEAARNEARNKELALKSAEAQLAAQRGELEAARQSAPADLASYRLAVQKLKNLPEPVDLTAAETEVKKAQAILEEAQKRCEAVEALAGRGLASEQALIEARFGRDVARADLEWAQSRLEEVRAGADPLEIAVAEAEEKIAQVASRLEIKRAEVSVAEAEIDVEWAKAEHEIATKKLETASREVELSSRYAPTGGLVVYEKVMNPGGKYEKVGTGITVFITDRVLSIISGEKFRFRGKASEADLSRIGVGLPASVTLEALPGQPLQGRVESFDIALTETELESTSLTDLEMVRPKVFDVLIALQDVPEGLMPGLSGKAIIEPVSQRLAPPAPNGAPASEAASAERATVRFAGFVDALDKTPIFTPADVMGYITKIVPQYSTVRQGDVILEATGDRARAMLVEQGRLPELAEGQLETARLRMQAEAGRSALEVERAELRCRAAELRLELLGCLPHPHAVKMAEAKVRKRRLELGQAQKLLDTARAFGLESQRELEQRELDARLAEFQLEEDLISLGLVRRGAKEEETAEAAHALDEARAELAYAREWAAQSARTQEVLLAEAETGLTMARGVVEIFEQRLARRIVCSPASGNVVFGRHERRPDRILGIGDYLTQWPNAVGYVCDLGRLKFCAVVEQPYVSRIRVGDRATVRLLAVPGRTYSGEVSAIMPLVMDREQIRSTEDMPAVISGVRSTRVDIMLELAAEEDLRILPGMTGTAALTLKGEGDGALAPAGRAFEPPAAPASAGPPLPPHARAWEEAR